MFRRFLAVIIGFIVCINLLWIPPVQGAADNSIIRVRLSSMGTPKSVTINVDGYYGIPKIDKNNLLDKGRYTIGIESGQLVLKGGNISKALGNSFTFKRYKGSSPNQLKIGSYNYLGDMEVRLEGGSIQLINHVHLETYLYGVVPYEVSDSWPIEAQKAQAVAARTYAVRSKNSKSYYDVHDTVNSQVYRGYDGGYTNSIKAVNDTFGKVLKYGSQYAQTVYSSSNGGMVESSANLWGNSFPYLVVNEDAHDVNNTSNPNRSWEVSYPKKQPLNSALLNRLGFKSVLEKEKIKESEIESIEIKGLKFNNNNSGRANDGQIVFELVMKPNNNIMLFSSGNSIKETETIDKEKANADVEASAMKETNVDVEASAMKETNTDAEPSSVEEVNSYDKSSPREETDIDTESSHGEEANIDEESTVLDVQNSVEKETISSTEPSKEKGAVTNDETSVEEKATTKAQIFTMNQASSKVTKEITIGFDKRNIRTIFKLKSLLFTVHDSGNSFILKGSGYGHGIGMSQWGAHKMARDGEKYSEILSFYYPGTKLDTLSIGQDNGGAPKPTQPAKPDPKPDPKPEPKPDPKPNPKPAQQFGKVNVFTTLNVRKGAGTNYKRIGSLRKGTRVEILGRSGAWYKIKTGSIQGYVHGDYIVLEDKGQTPPPSSDQNQKPGVTDPAPPPSDDRRYGIVTASALNVRSGPSTKNHRIGMVVRGAKLTILNTKGAWYRISFKGKDGYVHGDYVKLESVSTPAPAPTQPPTNTASGKAIVTASALNVRSGAGTNYKKIGRFVRNSQVEFIGKQGSWYKVKYGNTTGFVHGDYLKIVSNGGSNSRTTQRTGVVNASALNVRTGPGLSYSRVALLPRGKKVTIIGESGAWYRIQSGSTKGYVSKTYIK